MKNIYGKDVLHIIKVETKKLNQIIKENVYQINLYELLCLFLIPNQFKFLNYHYCFCSYINLCGFRMFINQEKNEILSKFTFFRDIHEAMSFCVYLLTDTMFCIQKLLKNYLQNHLYILQKENAAFLSTHKTVDILAMVVALGLTVSPQLHVDRYLNIYHCPVIMAITGNRISKELKQVLNWLTGWDSFHLHWDLTPQDIDTAVSKLRQL